VALLDFGLLLMATFSPTHFASDVDVLVPSRRAHRTSSLFELYCLFLLAAVFAYSVLQYGGVSFTDWNICLLILGGTSAVYWSRSHVGPPSAAALLLPAYIALQMVPLPMFLARLLSPSRAASLDSLAALMRPLRFA
jgi:hypothetical protein